MTTNTTPGLPPTRRDPRQVTNTLRITVNYNDTAIGTGEGLFSSLPQGAFISQVLVNVVTTFNAGTTNNLFVGGNPSAYNNIVSATADVNLAATGTTSVTRGLGTVVTNAADTAPVAMVTMTGTTATQGQAIVLIVFEGGWAS